MPSATDIVVLSQSNIVIGCLAAVISSACQSIGLILQRKAHLMSRNGDKSTSPYKRSLWHIGFLLFIFANIFGSTIQITNLPLIVLSPLQATGIVFNTIFHSLILHEPFTRDSLVGTVLVSFGALLIAYFGGQVQEPDTSLDTFVSLLNQRAFKVWALVDGSLVVLMLVWIRVSYRRLRSQTTIARKLRKLHATEEKLSFTVSQRQGAKRWLAWAHFYLYKFYVETYDTLFNHTSVNIRKCQGLLYGCCSGTLSAHSLLLAKSSLDILISTFSKHQLASLNSPVTYGIVGTFLVLCLSQLYLLNQGLKTVSTALLYPLIFCVYNMVSIGNGLIFYQQWKTISTTTEVFVFIGTALVVAGVFALSSEGDDEQDQPNESTFLTATNNTSNLVPSYNSTLSIKSNEEGFTSIQDMTTSFDNADLTASVSNHQLSTSAPLSSTSRSDILGPVSDNINSASRKVSGWMKKFHADTSINSGSRPVRTNVLKEENDPSEYVSFGSIKDSSSFINNYEVSSIGATNNTSSNINVGSASFSSDTSFNRDHRDSLDASNRRQQGPLRQAKSLQTFHTSMRSPRKKQRPVFKADVIRSRFEEEYNPNNTFNYSLSNTIEEIQNQLNTIDSKKLGAYNAFGIEPIAEHDDHDMASSDHSQTSIPSPTIGESPISRRHSAFAGRRSRNFTTGTLRSEQHRRELSFEQSELLNELRR